tara:strand:- start:228 stop:530 length:303 start_codon:yes stop_codon:yes gene_type:complete
MSEVTNNGQTATYYANLPMYDESVSLFDFKAVILSSLGAPAKNEDLTILELYDLGPGESGQPFNGVPDIQEYIEVANLVCTDLEPGVEDGELPDDTITIS